MGEGVKRDYAKLVLANTDPQIIKFFIWWLEIFLKIPKEKIKATLHLYENMNIEKEKELWKSELALHDKQFYKPQIIKLRKASFSYRESFRHGTCSIYVGGVDKHREVMAGIRAFLDNFETRKMGT